MLIKEFGPSAIFVIEEIEKESKEFKEKSGVIVSIAEMDKFLKVDLSYDSSYNLFYSVDIEKLIKTDITQEDLFNLFCYGWELSEDKKSLILKI